MQCGPTRFALPKDIDTNRHLRRGRSLLGAFTGPMRSDPQGVPESWPIRLTYLYTVNGKLFEKVEKVA